MKKLMLLGAIALTIMMSACTKDSPATDDSLVGDIINSSNKQVISPDQLSQDIQDDLSMYNFDSYIEEAWYAPEKGYQVIMGDEELVYFSEQGRRLDHRGRRFLLDEQGPCRDLGKMIPKDKLPEAILEYIEVHYPDHEVRIGKLRFGKMAVLLSPRKVLLFELDGTFIEEAPGFIHCPLLCKPVALEELAQEIIAYIDAHYPGSEIKRACIRRLNFTTVGILTPDGPRVLVFNKDHQFLFTRP